MSKKEIISDPSINPLIEEVRQLIAQSRHQLAVTVNSAMTMLYWQIGQRINNEILQHQRAEYGKQIILSLSKKLTESHGKGWSVQQLRHCLRIAETFPEKEIVYTLCTQLSWSHIRLVMFIEEPLKRRFYIEMCKLENGVCVNFKAVSIPCFTNVPPSVKIRKRPFKMTSIYLRMSNKSHLT